MLQLSRPKEDLPYISSVLNNDKMRKYKQKRLVHCQRSFALGPVVEVWPGLNFNTSAIQIQSKPFITCRFRC